MRACFLLLFQVFLIQSIWAQDQLIPKSVDTYIEELSDSKDEKYEEILEKYKSFNNANPTVHEYRLAACDFMYRAFYDYYDDYNPNEDAFEDCLKQLIEDFPDNEQVILYKVKHSYGQESIDFCEEVVQRTQLNTLSSWGKSKLYEELAIQYRQQDNNLEFYTYAAMAENLNDSIDFTYERTYDYYEKSNIKLAQAEIVKSLDSLDDSNTMKSKATLMLKLGMNQEALRTLKEAIKDTLLWYDKFELAEVFAKNDSFAIARDLILEKCSDFADNLECKIKLFNHDYKYSDLDSLSNSYSNLQKSGFWADPLGMYGLKMFLRAPLSGWNLASVLKSFAFFISLLLIVIIPYLWVLPVRYLGEYSWFERFSKLESSWKLNHFWILSSLLLLVYFLNNMFFWYDDVVFMLNDDYYVQEYPDLDIHLANQTIFFSLASLLCVVFCLKRKDYSLMKAKNWSLIKALFLSFLIVLLYRTVYFTLVNMGVLFNPTDASIIIDSMASINSNYGVWLGFILIVILVPIYEEYMFRGIILGSVNTKVGFHIANVFQSFIFASLHENLSLLPFYIGFGIMTGLLYRKTGSLMTSIFFHMWNNLFAFIVIQNMV